ncbi:MAG: ribosomal protein [Parcubacteria group bacterium]|nr:ribosomal protein [Parcubacteria group bacterium]
MKKISLKEKTVEDMTKMLAEKREELRGLRFSGLSGRVKDSHAPKKLRAEIARVMTEIGARNSAA